MPKESAPNESENHPENPFEGISWTTRPEPRNDPVGYLFQENDDGESNGEVIKPEIEEELKVINILALLRTLDIDPFDGDAEKKRALTRESKPLRILSEAVSEANTYNNFIEELSDEELNHISDTTFASRLLFIFKCTNDFRENRGEEVQALAKKTNELRRCILEEKPGRPSKISDRDIMNQLTQLSRDLISKERERGIDNFYTARKVFEKIFPMDPVSIHRTIQTLSKEQLECLNEFCSTASGKTIKSPEDMYSQVGLDESSIGTRIFCSGDEPGYMDKPFTSEFGFKLSIISSGIRRRLRIISEEEEQSDS